MDNPAILVKEEMLLVCPKCPAAFGLQQDLRQHHAVYHDSATVGVCGECSLLFETVDNLSTHMLNTHSTRSADDYSKSHRLSDLVERVKQENHDQNPQGDINHEDKFQHMSSLINTSKRSMPPATDKDQFSEAVYETRNTEFDRKTNDNCKGGADESDEALEWQNAELKIRVVHLEMDIRGLGAKVGKAKANLDIFAAELGMKALK